MQTNRNAGKWQECVNMFYEYEDMAHSVQSKNIAY